MEVSENHKSINAFFRDQIDFQSLQVYGRFYNKYQVLW